MLVIQQSDRAITQRGLITHRALNESWRTMWGVIHYLRLTFLKARDIDHVNIGFLPVRERSTIVKSQECSWVPCDSTNRFFQRLQSSISMPVRQDKSRPVGIDHLGHVSTRIAQSW